MVGIRAWAVAALGVLPVLLAPYAQAQPVDLAIELFEWGLTPQQIRVAPGEEIHIRLHNNGTVAHNFVIEDHVNYDPLIASGGQANVFFIAGAAGTFPMFCAVPGHRQLGIEGTFVVNQTQTDPQTLPVDMTPVVVVALVSVAAATAVVILLRFRRRSDGPP
jgi:uncharacterized cupredoxin-like copper-binding protein